jgi:hypothetical protein
MRLILATTLLAAMVPLNSHAMIGDFGSKNWQCVSPTTSDTLRIQAGRFLYKGPKEYMYDALGTGLGMNATSGKDGMLLNQGSINLLQHEEAKSAPGFRAGATDLQWTLYFHYMTSPALKEFDLSTVVIGKANDVAFSESDTYHCKML